MGSAENTQDLPGFYRDPRTGKYFREISPAIAGVFRNNRSRNPIVPYGNTSQVKNNLNVANLILKRNIGYERTTNFKREFFKVKTRGAHVVKQFTFQGHNNNVHTLGDIHFLKSARHTIIGCWANVDPHIPYCKFYIGEMNEYLNPPKRTNYHYLDIFSVSIDIADLCECYSQQRNLVFISNHPKTGIGSVYIMNTRSFEDGYSAERKLCSYIRSPIWCCSSNRVKSCFAVGVQRSINIYSTTNNLCSLTVPGNVHAIQFDRSGNLIYSGLHTGEITVSDLRARHDYVNCFPLGRHCVDQIQLFKREHYAICGEFNGRLCKVDVRMNWRSVVEYEGHVHTPRKTPISFSERFDVLCGTGADNITRLWSLEHGGAPVHFISSKEHPEATSCAIVLDSSYKCGIYHVAKDLVTVYKL